MKALKDSGVKTSARLATSVATLFGVLSINIATAQNDTTQVDIETCQTLSDSTDLDKDSIEMRVACYSRDVQHLNQLVQQLRQERDQLLSQSATDETVENYKQELAQRQESMQRLEERAAELNQQIDVITADRDQMREQLSSILSEDKRREFALDANEKVFESFSQSYMTLTRQLEELRSKLAEFENKNTELSNLQTASETQNKELSDKTESLEQTVSDLNTEKSQLEASIENANTELTDLQRASETQNQELTDKINMLEKTVSDLNNEKTQLEASVADATTELTDLQLASEKQNQQFADKINTLEQTVSDLNNEKSQLEASVADSNTELETIKQQLIDNASLTQERLGQIDELKRALNVSEDARLKLEADISELNQAHLAELTELADQSTSLTDEILSLEIQQADLVKESKAGNEALSAELEELTKSKQDLNAEREQLIAKVSAMEATHLEQTQNYQKQATTLEEQISVFETEKSELSEQLQEQKSANDKLKEYASNSNQKSEELDLLAKELDEKLTAADAANEELQANIDALNTQSEEQKSEFSNKLTELNATIDASKAERDAIADELDIVKPKLETAEQNLISSNNKNEALSSDIEALEQQLAKANEQQQALQASLEDTEKQSVQTNARIATLKKDSAIVKTLLDVSRKHSKNADAALAELRTEIEASDDRLAAKQKALEALLAEKNRLENESKAVASKSKALAGSIQEALAAAGHDDVDVAVSEDNSIGVLLGSGQLFKTGSSRLSEGGKKVLTDLAETFAQADDRRIMISGHSDNVPLGPKLSEIYKDNWGLSMARALATANFLTEEANVAADRMTVSGFGATKPIADNDTEEGRQQNRRVEIKLTPLDEQIASAK